MWDYLDLDEWVKFGPHLSPFPIDPTCPALSISLTWLIFPRSVIIHNHRTRCSAACSFVLNCVMLWSRPCLSIIATQNCYFCPFLAAWITTWHSLIQRSRLYCYLPCVMERWRHLSPGTQYYTRITSTWNRHHKWWWWTITLFKLSTGTY